MTVWKFLGSCTRSVWQAVQRADIFVLVQNGVWQASQRRLRPACDFTPPRVTPLDWAFSGPGENRIPPEIRPTEIMVIMTPMVTSVPLPVRQPSGLFKQTPQSGAEPTASSRDWRFWVFMRAYARM